MYMYICIHTRQSKERLCVSGSITFAVKAYIYLKKYSHVGRCYGHNKHWRVVRNSDCGVMTIGRESREASFKENQSS